MGLVKKNILGLSLSKVPILKALLPLIIGIVLAESCLKIPVNWFVYLIILCLLLLVVIQQIRSVYYRKIFFSCSFFLMMCSIGIWTVNSSNPVQNKNHFSNYTGSQIEGIIDDEPVYKEKTIRFPLKISSVYNITGEQRVQGRIMLTILRDTALEQILHYGDVLVFKNKISNTDPPRNPHEFNYQQFLAYKGIKQQCFLTSAEYKIVDQDKGNFIIQRSLQLRQYFMAKFAQYIHNPEAYQIAITLLFGYRSQIDLNTIGAFTSTGTIHVLSVSGLHVSLVFGLLTYVLLWLDRIKYGRFLRLVIILMAVWGYVILTGMSPPILRAGIMITFFIFSTLSGHKQVALNTLLASALFILILSPNFLFDVGFQLSYAAMLGILLFYPLLRHMWIPTNKWCKILVEYSYISISAQLFTLPFALYYFGQFPVYFLIANLFIAVPSTVIMYLGIALALFPVPIVNCILGRWLDWLLIFTVDGLKFIANLPFSLFKGIVWDGFQTFLLTIGLIVFLIAFDFRSKRFLMFTLLSFTGLILLSTINRLQYFNYNGIRVYNVRAEIAIAAIDNGKVILFSTLDSVTHSVLKFSVLPDLLHYSDESNIIFVKLRNDKRANYAINVGGRQILILENKLDSMNRKTYDCIVWRKNNRNDLETITTYYSESLIIIDGSNSAKYIDQMPIGEANKHSIYLLKNNFAYVWDREL